MEISSNSFVETDIKGASKQEKLDFLRQHIIDLIDLIEGIQVKEGKGLKWTKNDLGINE